MAPPQLSVPIDSDNHAYVGLFNQAQTCYLNSLLQTLYMTPEFRNALYGFVLFHKYHHIQPHRWQFAQQPTEAESASSIAYQLQRLFIALQTSEENAVETKQLTQSFGWSHDDGMTTLHTFCTVFSMVPT